MLSRRMLGTRAGFAATAFAVVLSSPLSARADQADIARGQYLVTIAGCNDCHTPGYFFGKPDMDRFLGGSDVGFEIPGLGVFLGRNLTPDKETGIGNWTTEEIVAALQTGIRPDGRMLAPIMPYHAFAHLTKEDVTAIADYLKTIKPVNHAVPGPFGPGQKVPTFVMRIVPPGATAAAAPK
ncbi:MAG: c-type cytochrome [Rhizobiaceae bacterium]